VPEIGWARIEIDEDGHPVAPTFGCVPHPNSELGHGGIEALVHVSA
jgi:hypothetical protein